MLCLAVHLIFHPGHDEFIAEAFRKLQEASRKEPGCNTYIVQRSREDPLRYLVYEQYQDDAALEAHRNSAHFKQYAADGVYKFVAQRQAEVFEPL